MNRHVQARAMGLQAEIMALVATDPRQRQTLTADAGVHRNSMRNAAPGVSKRGMTLATAIGLLDAMGYELRIVEAGRPVP